MGVVYNAHDTELNRKVAIKLPKLNSQDETMLKRFHLEAQIMSSLRHPNLCPVYSMDEFEGAPFFTMAYIEGRTLSDYLREGRNLEDKQTAKLVYKLADALSTLHNAGVIHRDLKPANVIVDENDEPVILDFGLASQSGGNHLTEFGEIIGTPAYMPPEQACGRLDCIGPASDIYSLGTIMYQMLTGQLPYTEFEDRWKTKTSELIPPSEIREGVSDKLEQICLKALSKNVADRFASACEMVNALAEYLVEDLDHDESSFFLRNQKHSVCALQRRRNLSQRVGDIRKHWQNGSRQVALTLLHDMATLTHVDTREFAKWAKQELQIIEGRMKSTFDRQATDLSSAQLPSASCQLRSSVPSQTSDFDSLSRLWLNWAIGFAVATLLLVVSLNLVDTKRDGPLHDSTVRPASLRTANVPSIIQASAKQASAKQISAKQISAKQASAKQISAKQISAKQISAKQISASGDIEAAPTLDTDDHEIEFDSSWKVDELESQLTKLANLVGS
ncbi:MAG: serine/threonine protein kinase [Pirellulaceae bacterium]|jgi:serine/threonine protein kinase